MTDSSSDAMAFGVWSHLHRITRGARRRVVYHRYDGDVDGAELGRARAGRHSSRHHELGTPSSSYRPAPHHSNSTLVILPDWSYLLWCAFVSILVQCTHVAG
jgi:hypothetical protein